MAIGNWARLMADTVVITPYSSRNAYGAPGYTTAASTYTARVVEGSTLQLPGPDGHLVLVTHTAWLATTNSISVKDKFSYDGSTYRIVSVSAPSDAKGRHHTKVMLG